jgi:hypothetical protein
LQLRRLYQLRGWQQLPKASANVGQLLGHWPLHAAVAANAFKSVVIQCLLSAASL